MASIFKSFTDECGIVARRAWNGPRPDADMLYRIARRHVEARIKSCTDGLPGEAGFIGEERVELAAKALASGAEAMISAYENVIANEQWPPNA